MAKITIYGLAGTGKGTVAKLLSEALGYENMSTGNMFRAMGEELGMNINQFDALANSDEKYDLILDQKVVEYGKTHDNFIFESRLAWHFIPDSFKIKFDCDFETRTKRITERENKTHEQVKEETIEREQLIFERYKKYYNLTDISNNKNFDFIVDTKVNNAQQVADIILTELKNRNLI